MKDKGGRRLDTILIPTKGEAGLAIGSRFGYLGDSLTAGAVSGTTRGWAWPMALTMLSGGAVRPVIINGFPGQRSDQILPHVAEILATDVSVCVVAMGTNDILQSVPVATAAANIVSACAQLVAAGIQPVLGLLPPNNGSYKNAITTLNGWLRRWGAKNRFPVIDFYGTLADPANGNYLAAYYNDGTHPNAVGYLAMAQTAWTTLQPILRPAPPMLTQQNADGMNLLPANTCFLTDAGADGIPDGWTTYGGGSGYTHSLITGDTSIKGSWAQIACASSASDRVLEFNATAGVVPGHTILVAGRIGVTAYTSGTGAAVKVTFTGGSANAYPVYQFKTVASGPFAQELVVPAGTTAILFDFIAGAGTGTYRLAQPTIYDLSSFDLAA